MATFDKEQLVLLLRECAGEDEAVNLDGDILDADFSDLGYDSLAMYNTVSRIERDFHISLGDDVLTEASTPRALLGKVNRMLPQPA